MNADSFDAHSDCSSEASETRSELECRIYSIVHHNDFSGTTVSPCIDPKYGVEFNGNGEVVVYLKSPSVFAAADDSGDGPSDARRNAASVIPTIVLDDDDDDDDPVENGDVSVADTEFCETSLKKKKKKKKKKRKNSLAVESVQEYVDTVKNTNALEEYKEKSGFNKMQTGNKTANKFALNVAFHSDRAVPMTPSEVLKQYRIGKPTKSSLWYRCPETWTPAMVKYYTKIQKSKRNFDCREELNKIKEKYGSSPVDWALSPMDKYKSHSNTPRVRCHVCRQFGHISHNCKEQYKPEICIMCGTEGHNIHSCNRKLCFSCGTWQKKFTNSCNICTSMSRTKCNLCNTIGHESNYCTESWRQFHSTISTATDHERNEFAQSTSKSTLHISTRISGTSRPTSDTRETSFKQSLKTNDLNKFKKARRMKRHQEKKRHSTSANQSVFKNESINIDVNVQDVVLKRTLTKKNFVKNKKFRDS